MRSFILAYVLFIYLRKVIITQSHNILPAQVSMQRRIQNPVEHLTWSFLREQLVALSGQLFLLKAPS